MTTGLLVVTFGLAIGVVLGMLGAGGAVLSVPVLVFVLDQDVKEATTASLLIVCITALVGAQQHARAGHVRLRLALLLSLGGTAGAILGTALNRIVTAEVILFVFAFVLFGAAYGVWSRRELSMRRESTVQIAPIRWPIALCAGMGVGVPTGLFGVGGGFLIVPILLVFFGASIRDAVGTSLAVITLCSAVGLAAHVSTGGIDWVIAGGFTAAGMAGVVVGSSLSQRIAVRRLHEGFSVLLVAVGALLLSRTAAVLLSLPG